MIKLFKNILEPILNSNQEFRQVYIYKFTDLKKIYVGSTNGKLNFRDKQHKTLTISPIFNYLNYQTKYEGPICIYNIKVNKKMHMDEIRKKEIELLNEYKKQNPEYEIFQTINILSEK